LVGLPFRLGVSTVSQRDPSIPLNSDGDLEDAVQRLSGAFLGEHDASGAKTPVTGNMGFAVDPKQARFDVRPIGEGEPAPPVIATHPEVRKFVNDIQASTVWYASRNRKITPAPKPAKSVTREANPDGESDKVLCPLCHGETWEPECYVCNGEAVVTQKVAARFRREG
jgi:hypothetical protein